MLEGKTNRTSKDAMQLVYGCVQEVESTFWPKSGSVLSDFQHLTHLTLKFEALRDEIF